MNRYDIGDDVIVRATVRAVSGALVNPGSLTLRIVAPDGTTTDRSWPGPDIVEVEPGVFDSTFTVESHGAWRYRWESTDPDGVEVGQLYGKRSLVPSP